MPRKVRWEEMLRHELEEATKHDPVVIVPVGSIEQHGPHNPMAVDVVTPVALAEAAAQAVEDFPVIVAPPIVYGITHYNMGFVGTISLSVETFLNLVCDVCRSIHANGFHRIIVINGHGGNHNAIRVAQIKLAEEDIFITAFSHWDMVAEKFAEWSECGENSIGHGGEWETSLLLYLRPGLVDRSRQVGDWPVMSLPGAPFAKFAERRREIPSGTMGDPAFASEAKGKKLFEAELEQLVTAVRAYHAAPVRRYREFGSWCP